jgi:hypothetical protein
MGTRTHDSKVGGGTSDFGAAHYNSTRDRASIVPASQYTTTEGKRVVLEGLRSGKLLKHICRDTRIEFHTIQKWQANDDRFNRDFLDARIPPCAHDGRGLHRLRG